MKSLDMSISEESGHRYDQSDNGENGHIEVFAAPKIRNVEKKPVAGHADYKPEFWWTLACFNELTSTLASYQVKQSTMTWIATVLSWKRCLKVKIFFFLFTSFSKWGKMESSSSVSISRLLILFNLIKISLASFNLWCCTSHRGLSNRKLKTNATSHQFKALAIIDLQ